MAFGQVGATEQSLPDVGSLGHYSWRESPDSFRLGDVDKRAYFLRRLTFPVNIDDVLRFLANRFPEATFTCLLGSPFPWAELNWLLMYDRLGSLKSREGALQRVERDAAGDLLLHVPNGGRRVLLGCGLGVAAVQSLARLLSSRSVVRLETQ